MKKRVILILLVMIFSFLILNEVKADVQTFLNITPSNLTPPTFLANIPTQTWAINTNASNAFDLDDYFTDEENLSYNYSSVSNITVTINPITHFVSLFSDIGFQGLRGVIFTAYDTFSSTESNNVTLNVTNDTQAPAWSNPYKDKSIIYQNTVVRFFTDWQDNIALSGYIFSIKQEGAWSNYSSVPLTGKQSTSNSSVQISAPGGTLVYWRFYGFDTSGNINASDIQNFTVAPFSVPSSSASTSNSDKGSFIGSIFKKTGENPDFSADPATGFHIEIIQGGSGIITIKITNEGESTFDFEIEISGLEEFERIISDSLFNLSSGESKTVTIEIKADKNLLPDTYYGKIKIKTASEIKEIPIVIVVKPLNTQLSLNVLVPLEYKTLKPGQTVRANITLKNLKDITERNVALYYAITDFYGSIINLNNEEFMFSQGSILMEKNLSLPNKMPKGEYIFLARAVSGSEIAIDSDIFEVGETFNAAGFVKTNFLIITLVLSSIMVALLMSRHHKSKEKLRLLNLYVMVNQLNKLINEGKHEEAIDIYVRIKSSYGEPVSKTALDNKDLLIKEMKKLAETINKQLSHSQPEITQTAQPQIKIEDDKEKTKIEEKDLGEAQRTDKEVKKSPENKVKQDKTKFKKPRKGRKNEKT